MTSFGVESFSLHFQEPGWHVPLMELTKLLASGRPHQPEKLRPAKVREIFQDKRRRVDLGRGTHSPSSLKSEHLLTCLKALCYQKLAYELSLAPPVGSQALWKQPEAVDHLKL